MKDNFVFDLITLQHMHFYKYLKKLILTCDSGKYACGIFLVLENVFDTGNHNILLKKLIHYGIRGNATN